MKLMIRAGVLAIGAATTIVAVAGCGAESSESVPTGADLTGTWIQSGAGYEQGAPVVWENQTLVIESADGQGFTGFKEYTREGEQPQREAVNGVIGLDGNILIVDGDGRFDGRLTDGKLQGQYGESGADAAAINVEISRQ
jgi:hypothetical protein